MNKKFNLIMWIFFIIILGSFINAQTSEYDYYFGVGESELFKYYPSNLSLTYRLIVEDSITTMNVLDDYAYSYITCSEEKDIPFTVVEISSTNLTNITAYDLGVESQILMDVGKIYALNVTKTSQHYLSSEGEYFVCASLSKNGSVNLNVVFYVGDTNGTNINWVSSSPITVSNPNMTVYCSDLIIHEHEFQNVTSEEYFGVSCTNCNSVQKVGLGVDLNTTGSARIFNSSSVFYNYTNPNNFAIRVLEDLNNFEFYELGEFRCRIPYNINVKIKRENTTYSDLISKSDYCDELSTIVFKPYSINYGENAINSMNSVFKWIPGADSLPKLKKTYDDVVFWNNYDSCSANIKMYEIGNFSILLGNSKIRPTFIEFVDPRNQDDNYYTDITKTNPYEILNKSDSDITIYASLWEITNGRYLADYINIGLIIGSIILIPVIIIFGIRSLFK